MIIDITSILGSTKNTMGNSFFKVIDNRSFYFRHNDDINHIRPRETFLLFKACIWEGGPMKT